ncbi:flagellar hook-length control protein FliK [Chitiniphilus purpureus]|uniref:Flagellar hook-length control protein FliK n=1 Tax=Chitiniphilus purpureus TaxID=2981137 RepID=A0ABY6DHB5_9NEIS|nr:flagellar hook-length control protein FliK [Chitiniphilus sp. CD1]UXY13711.1 flagellar hook-length control protein FliK [Chitiniphilus sp. CD1]
MLPGNTSVSLLQLYVKTQQGLIEVLKPTPDDALRFTVGERVQATVVQQLPNGRFAVLIKDQLLDLNLPRNTQPGEEMELTVVAREPKLTFANNQAPVPQLPMPQTREAALSQAARYLSTLLTGQRSEGGREALALQGSEPLFEGKPDAAHLAARLSGALSESGLFYEAHQAEWVKGERSLQALLREPQAQMPRLATEAGQTSGTDPAAQARSLLNLAGAPEALAPESQALLKGLVQQQLDAIEQRPLIWQGQAWPGQPLEWRVQLENERDADGQVDAAAQHWQTQLNLTLPKLGAISITATLYQGQFNLQFASRQPATLAQLRAHQAQLGQQFEAAGLTLGAARFQLEGAPGSDGS